MSIKMSFNFSSLVGVVLACWVVLRGGNLFSHKQGSIAHSLSLSPWTTILIKLKSAKKDTKLQTSTDPSTTNVSYIPVTALLDNLCPCVESKNQSRTKCCIPIVFAFSDVCMYKGQPYYQGQTWQDGCDHNCYCQDGTIGLWTCSSV